MFFNVFLSFPTFSNVTYSHSHSLSHYLTLSHSHTLSISHSITLDMLNKFCFHLYAQNTLFIGENCNAFFLTTLHLKQLSLLSMISRLPDNILNKIGRHVLTVADDRTKSWFLMVRDICLLYQLPHPLSQLDSPLPKEAAKQLFRAAVIDYWETKLRTDAALLPSLQYFKPQFMSLDCPHPIYQTCGSNSYEICKAIVQAKMVSGRYRTDRLVRHFYPDSDGNCSICPENVPGTIEHILTVSLSE